jgi:hypothetical protein
MSRRSSGLYRRSLSSRHRHRSTKPARRRRRLAMTTAVFATSSVVASAALIAAAPVHQPSLPDLVPVVQVHDVALASSFDPTAFITSLEIVFVDVLRESARLTDLNELPVPQALDDFGLGSLTPNELLSFTGLGSVTLNELAGFFYLGANPVSVLLAVTGLSDATTLTQAVDNLGIDDLPLSDLENLFGLSANDTLSQTADILGVGNQPISNLWDLIGLNANSTLSPNGRRPGDQQHGGRHAAR